jgi:hypothetical protein
VSGNYGGYGGGINNESGGTLTVSDCMLSDNQAGAAGGGIYNFDSKVTVVNSTLSGNFVTSSAEDGQGGGLYSDADGKVTMTGCTLSGNSAAWGEGGGIWMFATTMTISGCTFTGNAAGYGGGIYNGDIATALTISDSVFSANIGGNIFGPSTDGGGNTFS